MARNEKKAKRRVNPFDVMIVLLVLCLIATFIYRVYNGVSNKNDNSVSEYVLTFECDGKINSIGDYLDEGTPVYLLTSKELLGYMCGGDDEVKVTVLTEAETGTETETESGTDDASIETETEKMLEYKKANIVGKLRLCADVQVYSNGVYYSVGDVNFAVGSVIKVYTEEVSFTVTVTEIAKVD